MRDIAANYDMSLITGKLDKAFGELAKYTRRNKYVKITYKPGRRISFENNPIGQCEECIFLLAFYIKLIMHWIC